MPTNIEIKARSQNPHRQRQLAAALATAPIEILHQIDTFFNIPSGRLKLREFGAGVAQLIYYHRADLPGGMMASDYSIVHTHEPAQLREMLAAALGIRGQVRKERTVYHAGQTRIHCDEVEQLGSFLELEVVLRPDQSHDDGRGIAEEIRRSLEISDEDIFHCAYIDLLLAQTKAISAL